MRSYGQYCALARSLDVIGDRWTLLIVRELLLRGPCRYTDLRNGLPGIATNLLADRLRELEQSGLVASEAAPPPVATTLFRLTERGGELEVVIYAIGRWGGPFMAKRSDKDAFLSHWLAMPLRIHLTDNKPEGPPVALELRVGGEPVTVEAVGGGAVAVRSGPAAAPAAVLTGTPELVLAFLLGQLELADAEKQGLRYEGDRRVPRRFQPRRQVPSAA